MTEKKKKLKIMSLSVEPETQDLLRVSAKRYGCSVSELMRKLVKGYLDLVVNDGEKIPVVLRIPAELVETPEELRVWLNVKVGAIVNALAD
jgi:hypothetical protein